MEAAKAAAPPPAPSPGPGGRGEGRGRGAYTPLYKMRQLFVNRAMLTQKLQFLQQKKYLGLSSEEGYVQGDTVIV